MRTVGLFVSLLLLLLSAPVTTNAATAQTPKQKLAAELMEALDTEEIVRTGYRLVLKQMNDQMDARFEHMQETLTDEERAEWNKSVEAQRKQTSDFADRLMQRLDFTKIAEENFAPIFIRNYSEEELAGLLAFYKTPLGAKHAADIPNLGIGFLMAAQGHVSEVSTQIAEEMQREQREKQPKAERTMADMRTIAVALEAYATDNERFPEGSFEEIAKLIAPTYIRTVPMKDAWGNDYVYLVSADRSEYRIVSPGSDDVLEWDSREIRPVAPEASPTLTHAETSDIVFQNGSFVKHPEIKKD